MTQRKIQKGHNKKKHKIKKKSPEINYIKELAEKGKHTKKIRK